MSGMRAMINGAIPVTRFHLHLQHLHPVTRPTPLPPFIDYVPLQHAGEQRVNGSKWGGAWRGGRVGGCMEGVCLCVQCVQRGHALSTSVLYCCFICLSCVFHSV